jgi:anti-sigma factor RsiW
MLTEADYEILDQYLDEELSDEEARRVEARLAAEPELSAAVIEMRSLRDQCQGYFASLEDDRAAGRVMDNVHAAIQRRRRMELTYQSLRWVSAAAACVLVGLLIWSAIPKGDGDGPGVPTGAQPTYYSVQLTDAAGQVVAAQRCTSLDEARRVADELRRYQEQLERAQTGDLMPVAERF